jgi:hypothetical protein
MARSALTQARTAAASRANFQVEVGSYVGNGTARTITLSGGFQPDFIMIKRNAGSDGAEKFPDLDAGKSAFIGSASTAVTGIINDFANNGFSISTNAAINNTGDTFYYFAFRSTNTSRYAQCRQFIGNGADNRNITFTDIGFTPLFVHLKGLTVGSNALWRTSSFTGDLTTNMSTAAPVANQIQNIQSSGFQVGTDVSANSSTDRYAALMIEAITGVTASGTFTGNGTTQSITGLGFQPDFMLIANVTTTLLGTYLKTTPMGGSNSYPTRGTIGSVDTTQITSFDSDGFTVGAGNASNQSGNTIQWFAIKSGNFTLPL